MTALNRKLMRDLYHMKGQAVAISAVIACGVATFVMSLSTLESLESTQLTYYDRYRFSDIFAALKRAPNTLAARIEQIPGVAQVETRVVKDVNLRVTGMAEPAVQRLISIPEFQRPGLNELYLRSGRYIEPGKSGEVLVGESFAESHDLHPGDHVTAIINGKLQKMRIVGVVLSPEYILQIREGTLIPDTERFGVFWMSREELAAAFNMEGAFNNVVLTTMRGASEEEIIKRLDDLLEPYGGIGGYGREDQLSHRFLSDEIRQLRTMGVIAPSIFLSVAAFLLNVVLSRIISSQREEIAALKAFGYSKWEVGWHYLKFVLLITVVGVAVGTAMGARMGYNMTLLYTQFYKFPIFHYHLDLWVVGLAFLISAGAGVVGSVFSVRRAVALPPAEAMRPEAPAVYRPTILERSGLQRFLPHAARMILRHLERRPVKSTLTSLGIALAVSVLILGSFSKDALDYIIDYMFALTQRQDITVTFVEPTSGSVMHEVASLPGVMQAEPFRATPTRMRLAHRSHRVGIMGLPPDADLYQLRDTSENPARLPPDGLLLSRKLAEILHADVGDMITVEVLEGERPVRKIPVTGLIKEFSGTNAYMNIDALRRMLHEGNAVSGAYLAVDENRLDELYTELKATPRVAAVTVKMAAIRSFEETIAENLLRMQFFNVLFASVIAFGVVYNSARISLSERSRDLATLRVIGFTRAEISAILLGELAVLTLVAIPLGCLIGYGFAAFLTLGLDTEMYRIPLVIDRQTYAFAATVVLVAAVFSGLVVRRRLDHLDLVGVLKTRE